MIQVELYLRGPVMPGSTEGRRERKIWRFPGIDAPEQSGSSHDKPLMALFMKNVWKMVLHHLDALGIDDVYGITISHIEDIRQVYPIEEIGGR